MGRDSPKRERHGDGVNSRREPAGSPGRYLSVDTSSSLYSLDAGESVKLLEGRSSGFRINRVCRPSQFSWLSDRIGLITPQPALFNVEQAMNQWLGSAARPRLQRRARVGFAPTSRGFSRRLVLRNRRCSPFPDPIEYLRAICEYRGIAQTRRRCNFRGGWDSLRFRVEPRP